MTKLPITIRASKTADFDVEQISQYICEAYEIEMEEVTLDLLINWIKDDLDMRIAESNHVFMDENGERLNG